MQTGLAQLPVGDLLRDQMINDASSFAVSQAGISSSATQDTDKTAEMVPSFFIIGPPRTGTTWLHSVLKEHAWLPTSIKETRFFDRHFHYGMDWYRAHFGKQSRSLHIGEVAPTYFASSPARDRIARTVPWAKVVCAFRNPVERVLSLYRIKRAYGMIPWSFEQAIIRDPELLESGKYASNLKAWQTALGPSQVLACVYDDLRENPQAYIDTLTGFISIPTFTLTPSQIEYVESSEGLTHPRSYYRTRSAIMMADWLKARRFGRLVATVKKSPVKNFLLGGGSPFTELSSELRLKLYDLFRSEVEQLEILLNRDFSSWKPRGQASSATSAA